MSKHKDALTINGSTDLNEAPVASSIVTDPRYNNIERWIKNMYSRDISFAKVNVTSPEEQKMNDAIHGRSFEALKKNTKVVGLKLFADTDQSGMAQPEFDMDEAAAVYDAEPFVRKSVDRQLNLWFKQGFDFISVNDKHLAYIVRRFRDIAFVSGLPTLVMFKTIVRDLLKFSNAFVVKLRNEKLSSGTKKDGLPSPIAGYYPVSVLNMFPKYEKGRLVAWVRFTGSTQQMIEIPVRDVIHFTIDREPDFLYGKPRSLGVVEDVAALRRIEENIETLLVKYLFPLFQFTVGTDESPAQYYGDGTSELDAARVMLQDMEQEGLLVGTERHSLDVVGAKSQALDATKYLQHFKTRLFSGLGVSALDLGEGDTANRSTADNISQNLKEMVIETQREFVAQVQQYMIAELFMESPEDISALNAYNSVNLQFHDPDLDSRLKWQNHVLDLWNNDIITESEARDMLGLVPMNPEDRQETRFSLIDIPLALIAAVDEQFTMNTEAKTAVKTRTGTGTGGGAGGAPNQKKTKRPGSASTRVPSTKARPENQFGKALGPTKRKSSFEADLIGAELSDLLSMMMLDITKSPAEIIKQRFSGDLCTLISKSVGSVIDDIESHTTNPSDIRAALVAEFMLLKDVVKSSKEESNV